jgi:hypothetical protein
LNNKSRNWCRLELFVDLLAPAQLLLVDHPRGVSGHGVRVDNPLQAKCARLRQWSFRFVSYCNLFVEGIKTHRSLCLLEECWRGSLIAHPRTPPIPPPPSELHGVFSNPSLLFNSSVNSNACWSTFCHNLYRLGSFEVIRTIKGLLLAFCHPLEEKSVSGC